MKYKYHNQVHSIIQIVVHYPHKTIATLSELLAASLVLFCSGPFASVPDSNLLFNLANFSASRFHFVSFLFWMYPSFPQTLRKPLKTKKIMNAPISRNSKASMPKYPQLEQLQLSSPSSDFLLSKFKNS